MSGGFRFCVGVYFENAGWRGAGGLFLFIPILTTITTFITVAATAFGVGQPIERLGSQLLVREEEDVELVREKGRGGRVTGGGYMG